MTRVAADRLSRLLLWFFPTVLRHYLSCLLSYAFSCSSVLVVFRATCLAVIELSIHQPATSKEFRKNPKRLSVSSCMSVTGHGIATSYGLDGPEIESRCGGRDFPYPSRPAPVGPTSLLYNGYRVFPGGKAAGGVALTTHHPI
jgi:hypothetical protein